MVKWSKFHIEGQQILDATTQKVARMTWHLAYVHPCLVLLGEDEIAARHVNNDIETALDFK
jgi:hypothetical protein